METAICPHCAKNIELEKIIKKVFTGKAQDSNFFNKLKTSYLNIIFICPECNKIIGVK